MIDSKQKSNWNEPVFRQDQDAAPPVEIPLAALSEEALNGVIEDFVLREGTDYGAQEITLATKVTQVHRQLAKKEVLIVFDPEIQSVTIMTSHAFAKLRKSKI